MATQLPKDARRAAPRAAVQDGQGKLGVITSRLGRAVVLVSLFASACTAGDSAPPPTTALPSTTSTTAPATTTTTATPSTTTTRPENTLDPTVISGFELTFAIIEDPPSTNPWFLNSIHRPPIHGIDFAPDPQGWGPVEAYPAYNIPRGVSLFQLLPPGGALGPLVALDVPGLSIQDGDTHTIEIRLDPRARFSDGRPLTAEDVVFTYEVLTDPRWSEHFDWYDGVGVTVLSDRRVLLRFDRPPTVYDWLGGVGRAPILPRHYWEPVVEDAESFEDLTAPTGVGAPTAGPFALTDAEPGFRYVLEAVQDYWDRGTSYSTRPGGIVQVARSDGFGDQAIQLGDAVGFTVGPYAERLTLRVVDSQFAALDLIADGEADFYLVPGGIRRGFSIEIALTNTSEHRSPDSGLRALVVADSAVTDEPAERAAIACLVERSYLAVSVLQGIVLPAYSYAPSAFYDSPGTACADTGSLDAAAESLGAVGWQWDEPPSGAVLGAGTAQPGPSDFIERPSYATVTIGGAPLDPITVAGVGPGYDPLIATYVTFIEWFLRQLGIPTNEPARLPFSEMAIDEDLMEVADIALVQIDPGDPTAIASVFVPRGPIELTESIERALALLYAARTPVELASRFASLSALLEDDARLIPLYLTQIEEWYSDRVVTPFEAVLDGFQAYGGMPELLQPAP